MNGYSIRYNVSIELVNGDYYSDSFDYEEHAREYIDECLENAEDFCENWKIIKIETSGGMIVSEEVIDEYNSDNWWNNDDGEIGN